MRKLRAALAVATAGLLLSSLFAGTGSAQLSLLPSLTPELLLEIANVDAPPEGIGLQVHADFPDENPLELDGLTIHSLTADLTPDGTVITRSAHTSETATGVDGVDECNDNTFVPTGVKWASGTMPIPWRMDLDSVPKEIRVVRTLAVTRSAHRIWPRAVTTCDSQHKISFSYDFRGLTPRNPKYDHTNMLDFGSLGGGALAVNYTWYSGTDIVEVDLRLNSSDYTWTNMSGVDRYRVKNVVAHELGHQLGLDDLGDPHGGLTMFARIGKGQMNKTTLGRGDLRGASALSP